MRTGTVDAGLLALRVGALLVTILLFVMRTTGAGLTFAVFLLRSLSGAGSGAGDSLRRTRPHGRGALRTQRTQSSNPSLVSE